MRAAGRILLLRRKGGAIFVNISDWSGQIQLLIGKSQVGEESWAMADCFDLGDIIGIEGELKHTQDRRADDFRRPGCTS